MPGVKDWLKKASNDLKASKKLSDDKETLDCSVFHTHQCSEKALKAFIISLQQTIPKSHDLRLLLEYCAVADPEFALLWEEGDKLNSYGRDSRYPSDHFSIDEQDAEEAIQMAERVLITIKRKLI